MSRLLMHLKNKKGIRRYIGPKRIFVLFLFSMFFAFVWQNYESGNISIEIVESFILQSNVYAVFIFIMISVLFSMTFIPTLPLNIAAGFFWGFALGGLYMTIATTLAGLISFVFARYLLGQPLAGHFDSKWINIVKKGFEKNDWKFLAFARMNPVIPTGPLNYILGLTSISTYTFIWATFLFILPPSLMFAYFGEILNSIVTNSTEINEIVHKVLFLSGAVVFLAILKFIARLYKNLD